MGRLIGSDAVGVQEDRIAALKECLRRYEKTTVLKGAATLIAEPGSEVLVNPTGNSGLATGGTGDVLSGTIAGLLGQKLHGLDAAACGVYMHGLAGELCAFKTSSIGYRASEVAEALPLARDRILKQCNSNRFSQSALPR